MWHTEFFVVLAIVLDVFIAIQFMLVAADKGYSENKYVWMCILFGPVGWLVVVALPDKAMKKQQKEMLDNLKKIASESKELRMQQKKIIEMLQERDAVVEAAPAETDEDTAPAEADEDTALAEADEDTAPAQADEDAAPAEADEDAAASEQPAQDTPCE